jgi:hypothetical protein
MLGRLRLTIDEAIDQYGRFARHIFSEKNWNSKDGMFKASMLKEIVKEIVKAYGVEELAERGYGSAASRPSLQKV